MKIYAPVKDFSGFRNNVRFTNGVGETDDTRVVAWFETHGYTVEKGEDLPQEPVEKSGEEILEALCDEEPEMMGYADKTPSLEDMNPNELRELAKEQGKGHLIKNIRNKEKLIEILRG